MSFITLYPSEYKPRIKEVDAVIKDYVLPIRYVSTYPATINEVSYKIKDLNYKIKDVAFGFIQSIWKDTVSISNVKTYQKTFNRSFSAELDIGFKNVSNFTKTLNNAIKFSFEKLGNSGQIISDIRLYDKVLNETNYDETITPYGYGKWKEMVTGDYIYEKALCKYAMQASLNADRPNTRIYQHKVDVPDRVQTGTVVLDTIEQPLHVKFDDDPVRAFHVTPEMNVSIKSYSGTSGTPEVMVYNIDRYGFDVTLKNGSEYVAGSITYAARAY